jgi:hypothetical protein
VAIVRQRINIIPGGLSKFVNFMNELKMKTFISNSMNLKTLVNSICSLRKSLVQFVFVVFKYQSYMQQAAGWPVTAVMEHQLDAVVNQIFVFSVTRVVQESSVTPMTCIGQHSARLNDAIFLLAEVWQYGVITPVPSMTRTIAPHLRLQSSEELIHAMGFGLPISVGC